MDTVQRIAKNMIVLTLPRVYRVRDILTNDAAFGRIEWLNNGLNHNKC
jgi:hypothetical protein